MAYNGSGAFVIASAGQPVVATTLITAVAFNAHTAEIATGLSNAICKDGQTTVTANIPLGGNKITGLGTPSAATDAATLGAVQSGLGVYVATVGGTADVITLTPSPAITTYAAGQTFRFIASGANTTNVTVAVSGLAAKAITKNGTTALVSGDIPSASMVSITYDGTRFILGTTGAATVPVGTVPVGAITTSGLTQATAKMLGRTTASTGAIEEITIGTGLTFSAGSLTPVTATTSAAGISELATQAEADAATASRVATTDLTRIVLGTLTATTSGTSFNVGSLPAGTRRIHLHLIGVSLSGSDNLLVQIGDSGGIETSGYLSSSAAVVNVANTGVSSSTAGFIVSSTASGNTVSGIVTLDLVDAATFQWVSSHTVKNSTTTCSVGGGDKALSAELTQITLKATGSDTFDAGAFNISYER